MFRHYRNVTVALWRHKCIYVPPPPTRRRSAGLIGRKCHKKVFDPNWKNAVYVCVFYIYISLPTYLSTHPPTHPYVCMYVSPELYQLKNEGLAFNFWFSCLSTSNNIGMKYWILGDMLWSPTQSFGMCGFRNCSFFSILFLSWLVDVMCHFFEFHSKNSLLPIFLL